MKRKIIDIDEEKCTGCGLCIPDCPEGALQIIDGKARLVSDLFCDGRCARSSAPGLRGTSSSHEGIYRLLHHFTQIFHEDLSGLTTGRLPGLFHRAPVRVVRGGGDSLLCPMNSPMCCRVTQQSHGNIGCNDPLAGHFAFFCGSWCGSLAARGKTRGRARRETGEERHNLRGFALFA
jgi:ferredoxin